MDGVSDTVLVVEADAASAKALCGLLGERGLATVWAASSEEAVAELARRPFDLVLSDVALPLLGHVTERYPETPVVLVTPPDAIALALDAMKAGAVDFVQEPVDRDEIGFVIDKALAGSRSARAAPPPLQRPYGLVGESYGMRVVFDRLRKVAPEASTVLVRGERGTRKELVARAIHENSPRKDGPFVRVHCGALSETLLESELFGYEKGAFTGATHRKPGRVELAHGGTLFLDEVGDISMPVQVKLLRVLQERELERLGGTETVSVDVRIVAATHRDLETMVDAGTFRDDLFYRLAVVPIHVPALRDRDGDVALLARDFTESMQRADLHIEDDAIALLASQDWPGNVRQLHGFLERLIVLTERPTLTRADVERELARSHPAQRTKETERDELVAALKHARNDRALAARLLDVSRRTLYEKLHEHGLE